jgi:type I restriction enzyme M protein
MITKQQLGNFLWGMADILYGKVEDYKSYILTLLFYKRLSDNYPWEENQKVAELEDEYGTKLNTKQLEKALKNSHIFQIPEGQFWKDIAKVPLDEKNEKIDFALNAIADANPKLKGIINTVKWNEAAPDGSGGKRLDPKILQELINHLDPMDLSNANVPLDILGHAYEYLIKRFADENKGGTVAGQFYTPPEVVELMVRYISPNNGMRVYDPTCGSGGFLIKAADYVKETQGELKGLRLYGQETIWNTWAIATMNLLLHGLEGEIRQGDTIQNPKFKKADDTIETFDVVLANFPFSVENWAGNGTPKRDKKGKAVLNKDGSPKYDYPAKDTYFDPYNRLIYGTPNFTNGDFAFIQHIIASLEPDGMAGVVCPNGVLFKGQPEKTEEEDGQNRKADDDYLIRRGFIEGIGEENKNIIDAIVALPENVFYGNTIPGAIVFFNKNKPKERKDKILMVWGAKEGWYKSEPDQNVLRPQDVMRLLVQLLSYGNIEKAKAIIPSQEKRLFSLVDDNLDFNLLEINERYSDEESEIAGLQSELLQTRAYFKAENEATELTLKDGTILTANIHKGKFELALKDKRKTSIPTNEKGEVEILFGAEQIIKIKLKSGNKATITKANINRIENRIVKLQEILLKKETDIAEAQADAEREKVAIQLVSQEMLGVFADPTLRRKYFAMVDMDELIENEFNLNLPRYIDTVEPKTEIPISEAKAELNIALEAEKESEDELNQLLEILN